MPTIFFKWRSNSFARPWKLQPNLTHGLSLGGSSSVPSILQCAPCGIKFPSALHLTNRVDCFPPPRLFSLLSYFRTARGFLVFFVAWIGDRGEKKLPVSSVWARAPLRTMNLSLFFFESGSFPFRPLLPRWIRNNPGWTL